jgi:transcription antitermination factor NusG
MMVVTELKEPTPVAMPAIDPEAPWYIVLTQAQQDLTTVWRLHELGLELFVPVIRKHVPTGRRGANGQKVTRVMAKPMFPGYGFLRSTQTSDLTALIWNERERRGVRGVRGFLPDVTGAPVRLPHSAVHAVFRRQNQEHQEWLAQAHRGRFMPHKQGDKVKFDEPGSVYDGLVSTIERVIKSKGQVQLTLGSIKHWVSAEKVVAA